MDENWQRLAETEDTLVNPGSYKVQFIWGT